MIVSRLSLSVLLSFGGFIALLVAAAIGLSLWSDRQEEQAETLFYDSQVALATQDILLNLQQAESSRRGYVITEDPAYAQACYSSIKDMERSLSMLKRLNVVEMYNDKFLDSLRNGLQQKTAALRLSIEKLLGKESSDSLQIMLTQSGHELMAAIRSTLGEMSSDKRQSANREYLDIRKNRLFFQDALFYSTLSIALILAGCCLVLMIHIRRRDIEHLKLENEFFVTNQQVMNRLAHVENPERVESRSETPRTTSRRPS